MEATVRFSASLYSESAIRAAATAYAFEASIENERGDLAVTLTGAELSEDVLDHFANHVLHETIVSRHAR
jgi:hypothetical protein